MASLKHLKASSGAGNAVIAHITNVRAIGQNEIKCDALTDWSDFFLASSGKLLGDGSIDQSTVTEFEGHKSGSSIIIDTYCPGYSDLGNTTDQIVVIKPTTTWSNTLNDLLGVVHNDDGSLKDNAVTLAKLNGGTTAGVLTTTSAGVVSASGNYSTTEVATNTTWVDGKMIYKKTVALGSFPNASLKNVAHGIAGLSYVVSINAVAYDGTTYIPLSYPSAASITSNMNVVINSTNISVVTGSDRTGFSGYATLTYTKA